MRKLFLLVAAVCCLVMNSWADCQLIGNEIPSGTGVNARSIINIQYNRETQILSFEDIYEPTFTAYERTYCVYFYEYSPDYAFYRNPSGGAGTPVFYGDGCNDDAFIPCNNSTPSTLPAAHFWTYRTVNDCAGGVINIDLSYVIPQIAALGYNHAMVGISPSYRISASASAVYYSTYGDWHSWLMNTAHFLINPVVDRIEGLVTEVHTPTYVYFYSDNHVSICEGQDTAKIQANIYPTDNVTRSVTYIWQKRTDDETDWHYQSQGTFTKTAWNNAVSAKSPLYANRTFRFSAGDMERVTCFRLALVCENDTIYSNIIAIDAKSRVKITGPVACKLNNKEWDGHVLQGTYPNYYFDTLTYEVAKSDMIRLKPIRSESECSIPIGGSITTDSKGNPCITDFWHSRYYTIGETHSVKLYVDGGLYANFDKVFCGFTPYECNYALTEIPDKVWKDRATGIEYSSNDVLTMNVPEDMILDAVTLGKYGLYILGERVTGLNKHDILGDGKVSYDPETKTLTLNDASISASAGMGVDAVAIYDSITIQCVGEMNSISNYSSNQNAAIVEDAGHVTITGNNSLLAIVVNGGNVLDLQNGLTIKDGCSVIAIRTRVMPYATINLGGGVLTVDGASFEADGSTLAPTIANCGGLVLKNAEITSGHTYDATTHKFLTAGGEEAKDMIMIESTATGLERLTVDDAQCTVKKMIIDNQLYIFRNNKLYNAQGGRVK